MAPEVLRDRVRGLDADGAQAARVEVAPHHEALDRERLHDARLDRRPIGELGAERRQPRREADGARLLAVEQGTHGKQVVGESLERERTLAAHLEARERPRERATSEWPQANELEQLG
jgi:hypothetical protein